MTTVETSIDIELPVRSVYNQWTQFEDFPRFMDGVLAVEQLNDSRLHWRAEIGGVRREWDAKIVEQIPDHKISWHSMTGAQNAGTVLFDELDTARTRVTLRLDFDPEGFVERAADVLGVWQHRVEGDLERFKDFLESRGMETGAWRGEIESGRTVKLNDDERRVSIDADMPRERSSFPVDPRTTPPPPRG